ncbi:hypothetical protein BOX15_Mlig025278g2 [Macrostomum lignano]|uniref:EF-hand domain-containing protein n=1 Tax=Macrostomum lignano TaxID=282301 RepID=A0A267FP26_9PLAT|nr:hypothetical protein BOX15_Mlig025278g2 [Macrostomum lignano]
MGESPQHSLMQNEAELDKIFHVLDEDDAGYITVEKFTEALNSFIPNEIAKSKLSSLLDHLDPQSDGKIYLNDFKKAISRLQVLSEDSLRGSHTSNGSFGQDALTPTAEEDQDTADGSFAVSAAAAVNELDGAILGHDSTDDARLVVNDGSHWQSLASNSRPGEESYEDWGSVELGPNCLVDGSGSSPGESDGATGLAEKPPLPPDTQLERGTEVRGTWPRHRPRPDNIKLNVPSRSPSLRSPHPSNSRRSSRSGALLLNGIHRPPSATQLAQQLYSTSSGRSSPRTSGDGMFYDEVDYPDPGIYTDAMNDQFKILNERIDQLTQSQSQADTRHNKLMEENQLLRERLNRQEDDFREVEAKLRRKIEEDKSRWKAKLNKITKDKEAEIERLVDKLRQTESALSEHRIEAARHRAESERLRAENARLEERAEALDARLNSAREDAERHRETSRRDLDAVKQERDKAQALLEELNRELDSWRSGGGAGGAGAAGGTRERTASAAEMFNRYREVELLAKRLTQENKNLREQLEEAQAELLTRGLEEGQALLRRHGGTTSLAAELETMTKDELMDLLVREKDGNEKLRNYIDRILLRIMEKQPDLLEVGMLA